MFSDVKRTKEIATVRDVEDRIYSAFAIYKQLPAVKPQGYFNIFLAFPRVAAEWDTLKAPESDKGYTREEYELAMEVCDVWWNWLYNDFDSETLEMIKYRCGAPIMKGGKSAYGWGKVRPWKCVAAEFRIHRNTVKNKWNAALEDILYKIKKNCV